MRSPYHRLDLTGWPSDRFLWYLAHIEEGLTIFSLKAFENWIRQLNHFYTTLILQHCLVNLENFLCTPFREPQPLIWK